MKSEQQMEQDLRQTVNKHGWQVQIVSDPEGKEPLFAYSIGMWKTLQHPEIIGFSMHPKVLHSVINIIGDRVVQGEDFEEHKNYGEILQNYPVQFRKVHPSHYNDYVGWAMWYTDYKPFQLLQLFWPDKRGKFPWEPGFNQAFIGKQPFLFQPNVKYK